MTAESTDRPATPPSDRHYPLLPVLVMHGAVRQPWPALLDDADGTIDYTHPDFDSLPLTPLFTRETAAAIAIAYNARHVLYPTTPVMRWDDDTLVITRAGSDVWHVPPGSGHYAGLYGIVVEDWWPDGWSWRDVTPARIVRCAACGADRSAGEHHADDDRSRIVAYSCGPGSDCDAQIEAIAAQPSGLTRSALAAAGLTHGFTPQEHAAFANPVPVSADGADDDGLREYLVCGLLSGGGDLTIAAVLDGSGKVVDSDPYDDEWQRWADTVRAASPDDAEDAAHALVVEQNEIDDDIDDEQETDR